MWRKNFTLELTIAPLWQIAVFNNQEKTMRADKWPMDSKDIKRVDLRDIIYLSLQGIIWMVGFQHLGTNALLTKTD